LVAVDVAHGERDLSVGQRDAGGGVRGVIDEVRAKVIDEVRAEVGAKVGAKVGAELEFSLFSLGFIFD